MARLISRDGFDVTDNVPIDVRFVTAQLSDISPYDIYRGLIVFETDSNTVYSYNLVPDPFNFDADGWVAVGIAGAGANSNPTTDTVPIRGSDGNFIDSVIKQVDLPGGTGEGVQIGEANVDGLSQLNVKGPIYTNTVGEPNRGNVLGAAPGGNQAETLLTYTTDVDGIITHGTRLTSTLDATLTPATGDVTAINGRDIHSGDINFRDFDTFQGQFLNQHEVIRLPEFNRAFAKLDAGPTTIGSIGQTEAFLLNLFTTTQADNYQEVALGQNIPGTAFIPADHDVTEFADVNNAGSGAIITAQERIDLGTRVDAAGAVAAIEAATTITLNDPGQQLHINKDAGIAITETNRLQPAFEILGRATNDVVMQIDNGLLWLEPDADIIQANPGGEDYDIVAGAINGINWGTAPTGAKPDNLTWNELVTPLIHNDVAGNAVNGEVLGPGFRHGAATNATELDFSFENIDERTTAITQFLIPRIRAVGPFPTDNAEAGVIETIRVHVEDAEGRFPITVFFESPITVIASDAISSNIAVYNVDTETIHTIEGGTYANGVLTLPEAVDASVLRRDIILSGGFTLLNDVADDPNGFTSTLDKYNGEIAGFAARDYYFGDATFGVDPNLIDHIDAWFLVEDGNLVLINKFN